MNLIENAEVGTARLGIDQWSPSEAFVALLIAGAGADGSVSVPMANGIEHVIAGMRLFRGSQHRDDPTDDREDRRAVRGSRRRCSGPDWRQQRFRRS